MKIGIDASRSQDNLQKTGVERMGDKILLELFSQLSLEHEILLYTPSLINNFPEKNQRIIKLSRFWTLARLSWEMLWHKPDIFFSPVHELPFSCPQHTYRIVHDVAFLKTTANYSWLQRLYMIYGLQRSLQICQRVFIPTQSVKNDIIKYYPTSENKLVVIGFGFDRKNPDNKVTTKQNQFVYIGRIEYKKNLINLVKAFKIFSQHHSDYKLILAGKPGFGFVTIQKAITKAVKQNKVKIELLDYISDTEKFKLQSQSKAVILVSYEEGFGIPILEGFDTGTRILASNIPALHEIGGELPVYVDPSSSEAIAQGLEEIIKDDRLDLDKGFSRLDVFSWDDVINKIKNNFNL